MFVSEFGIVRSRDHVARTADQFASRFAVLIGIVLALSIVTAAQTVDTPQAQRGRIMGTVTDINGDGVSDAKIVLSGPQLSDRRTFVTSGNGFFQFDDVNSRTTYTVSVTAEGFANWASSPISLEPGEFKMLSNVQLQIATQETSVHVTYNPEQAATEQFKAEEKQRVLGIIPNPYVTYDPDAGPLTSKQKFQMALRVSIDPVTIAGVGLIAGVRQAADSLDYPQGAKGYGERFGAVTADGFTDIMIGAAILPSFLHQDPRYFYQGTGSTGSRFWHAIVAPFVAKGDDGNWEPNYSSLGGDLGSAAISNLYYPRSNRGVRLVFGNFAIGTAERVGASLAQEFILAKVTHRGGHVE